MASSTKSSSVQSFCDRYCSTGCRHFLRRKKEEELREVQLLSFVQKLIGPWQCFESLDMNTNAVDTSKKPAVPFKTNIKSGSSNRVIEIEKPLRFQPSFLIEPAPPSSATGIIRMPLDLDPLSDESHEACASRVKFDCLNQVTTLQFLHKKKFDVPFLFGFGSTTINAIGSPWIFMEFLKGQPLHEIFPTMSLAEKKRYIELHVRCRVALEKIALHEADVERAGAIGTLCCSNEIRFSKSSIINEVSPDNLSSWYSFVNGKRLVRIEDCSISGQQPEHDECDSKPTIYNSCFEYLEAKLKQFRKVRKQGRLSFAEVETDLLKLLRKMRKDGYFTSVDKPETVLHHWDLYPRNIKVESCRYLPESSTERCELKVRFLDFDSVLCLPRKWTRKPDLYLWDQDEKAVKAWAKQMAISQKSMKIYHLRFDADNVPVGWYESADKSMTAEELELLDWYVKCWVAETRESEDSIRDTFFGRGRLERKFAAFVFDKLHLEDIYYRHSKKNFFAAEYRIYQAWQKRQLS